MLAQQVAFLWGTHTNPYALHELLYKAAPLAFRAIWGLGSKASKPQRALLHTGVQASAKQSLLTPLPQNATGPNPLLAGLAFYLNGDSNTGHHLKMGFCNQHSEKEQSA